MGICILGRDWTSYERAFRNPKFGNSGENYLPLGKVRKVVEANLDGPDSGLEAQRVLVPGQSMGSTFMKNAIYHYKNST